MKFESVEQCQVHIRSNPFVSASELGRMAAQRSHRSFVFSKRLIVWAMIFAGFIVLVQGKYEFKAIFNFGDSNSDTGGFWSAFPAQSGPFGMTYFKKPVGRASDGRLLIDFIAQALGLKFLSPYLQSIGPDYRHGANFATLASTVLLPNSSLFVSGISPFSLGVQLNQMKKFKAIVDELHHSSGSSRITNMPDKSVFRKSLYTIYIGQNDFTSNLGLSGISGVKNSFPQIVFQIAATIKELYMLGGRAFWILNLAPIGCYPSFLVELPHNLSDIDAFGCMMSYNNAVMEYNEMLKEALARIRVVLPHASVIYVDTHSILLDIFRYPKSYGLSYGPRACCGHGGGAYNFDSQLYCGCSREIGGRIERAVACKDPNKYLSWDGVHTTEAANRILAMTIFNGSYFHPSFPLNHLYELHPLD